jgi:hypothetical protein
MTSMSLRNRSNARDSLTVAASPLSSASVVKVLTPFYSPDRHIIGPLHIVII